jgi:hypothetical protein
VAEPEPGLYLAEWFDGAPLHEAADPVTSAVAVGAALRLKGGETPSDSRDALVDVV